MSEGRTARRLDMGAGHGGGAGWAPPPVEALADVFPGLRVLALAGRGGMGAVYRAEQTRLGRVVAVKLQPPGATADPLARERFEREARVLAELRHAHVVQIFDFGALADGTFYLVTEWAEGGDLAARLAAGPAGPAEAAGWVAQIAGALDAAHARGVVHRDLKPANVLVRGDGSLALADFGLARAHGAGFTTELTLSGVVFGTLDYMAPEQMGPDGAAGPVTPATDVYALGVMTYQMLTGRMPRGVFARVSSIRAEVPAEVDGVIEAALANDAVRRPQSAGEFARLLAAAARAGARRRKSWFITSLAGGVIAAGLIGLWAWTALAGRSEGDSRMAGRTGVSPSPVVAEERPPGGGNETEMPVASESNGVEPEILPTVGGDEVSAKAPERWVNLLAEMRPQEAAIRGGWTRRGEELASAGDVAVLVFPSLPDARFSYDVEVEFTRMGGRHSVGVILPTAAGTGIFELDAWDQGLGGLQAIDGRDLRAQGERFAASLRNGERQRVRLEVRGARVRAFWNGLERGSWELAGRRLSVPEIWETRNPGTLGLASWMSPTVFHRVEYRAAGAD